MIFILTEASYLFTTTSLLPEPPHLFIAHVNQVLSPLMQRFILMLEQHFQFHLRHSPIAHIQLLRQLQPTILF